MCGHKARILLRIIQCNNPAKRKVTSFKSVGLLHGQVQGGVEGPLLQAMEKHNFLHNGPIQNKGNFTTATLDINIPASNAL